MKKRRRTRRRGKRENGTGTLVLSHHGLPYCGAVRPPLPGASTLVGLCSLQNCESSILYNYPFSNILL